MRIPVLDVAAVDTVLTVVAAVALARFTTPSAPRPSLAVRSLCVFLVLLAVATLLHWWFCVPTRLLVWGLGPRPPR